MSKRDPESLRASGHPLAGLLTAQFFGAFNDNAWKLLVTLLGISAIRAHPGAATPEAEIQCQAFTTLAFVIFTLPLMLFSLPAGVFADRFSKRTVILWMKGLEVLLMAAAAIALYLDASNSTILLAILGMMGLQSALFSPAKYGILPEVLPHEKLSAGNGALELWTFLAIIAGTGMAGVLAGWTAPRFWIAGLVLAMLAVVGFASAFTIPRLPPARATGGLATTLRGAWSAVRSDRILRLTVVGCMFYWGIMSLLGQNMVIHSKTWLDLSDTLSGLPLAVFAVGVGAGAVLAGRLSAAKVEYGLIPLGAAGLFLFTLVLGVFAPGLTGTLPLMAVLGIASGLVVVPLEALLQWRSPPDRRGAVIAFSNVFTFGGVLVGSMLTLALSRLGLSTKDIFIASSVFILFATVWALRLVPDAFVRLVLILLTHTLYRLRVVGRQHVPRTGGALLVPNHVSFIDGLFLMASLDRPIRFLVETAYFRHPLLGPFLRAIDAAPVAETGSTSEILRALRRAGNWLDEGELVCIFAEGQITRTGTLLPFKRGIERVFRGRSAPVIPVHLGGVWGSIFSHEGGRFLFKLPRRLPYPVHVTFGEPLPAGTPVAEVRRVVHELGERTLTGLQADEKPLHHAFVRKVRRSPFSLSLVDASHPRTSRIRALTGALALARALRPHLRESDRIGILLPPSTAAGLVNIAAALSGRTSVNFNYTAGSAGLESAMVQAGIEKVVTSKSFLKKANLVLPDGFTPLWLEDVAGSVGHLDRVACLVHALFAPVRRLERFAGAGRPILGKDIATIIFSSGSTGEPKGVMLTHANIASNVEAVAQVLRPQTTDRLLGILPLFHSFGYMGLWFAACHGIPVVSHPDPLDAGTVASLVQTHQVTILVATPTFLHRYLRRCPPAAFGSLRLVVAGAEKLSSRLADAFEDAFGIRPLEGYGTTECSPVVAVSVPDFRAPGLYQAGARRGSVGRPLPSVSVRIVDLDTFERLAPGEAGMILARGPGVMAGYLERPDLTRNVMREDWYVTGDVGRLDEDGFLWITDRLSRFSKIGGEMVPHGRVEEVLQEAGGCDHQALAVTSVPDGQRGERLAVLHTLDEARIPEILETAAESGLPNLFLPRRDSFIQVERLPLLGTGKLDLREMKRIAYGARTKSAE